MAAVNKHTHWQAWQRAGTAATIAETSRPEWGRKMRRIKGARHAHQTIRASGRVPGEEARKARREKAAKRRLANAPRRYDWLGVPIETHCCRDDSEIVYAAINERLRGI